MTLQQFLLILRARYKLALLTLLLTVSVTLVLSLVLPKQYTAGAAVVLDVKSPDQFSGLVLQGMIAPSYMATQVDIINSDRVARAAVKLLHMEDSNFIKSEWLDSTDGKGELVDWLASLLQKKLDVKPSRDSNLININFTGSDPDFTAAVANAFAQAYMNVNLELRTAPARQYAAFFDEQTTTARNKLDAAQKAMSDYQQVNRITTTDDRLDFETAKLNETSSQLTGIQAQTTESQSKRKNDQADTVSDVMLSPLINGLKADIARLDAKMKDSHINLGNNHPQSQRNEAELSGLKAQLAAETRKITSSIETTYQVSKQREQQLQGALSVQKTKVLLLNKQRDELNVLRSDIVSAQRAFEIVSQRASQTTIESQTNQTNLAVLNPAVAPIDASRPRVFLNLLVSIFLGSLLGVGSVLMLELKNRILRSEEDLNEILEFPVLGSIISASSLFKANPAGATV
jgi:succinoglycan biosynthesis transport protein ExoP